MVLVTLSLRQWFLSKIPIGSPFQNSEVTMTVCHRGWGACNELALADDHDNGGGKWQWVSCNQGWRWRHYNHHHHRHRPHCCHHLLSSPSLSLLTTIVVLINIVVLLIIITGLLLILPATMDLTQPPLMQVATFLACSCQ